MNTVSLKEFFELESVDEVLVDLDTVPLHMRVDYDTRNKNVESGKE